MRPNKQPLEAWIRRALKEDVGAGDHTARACIPTKANRQAKLVAKAPGVWAGGAAAQAIFRQVHRDLQVTHLVQDGTSIREDTVVLTVRGPARAMLTAERLVLNCAQRMSGIATLTRRFVEAVKDHPAQILDTRKTTPNFRLMEKWAVRIGGGKNHRMGLDDMCMIKDNHADFCGGVGPALQAVQRYLQRHKLKLTVVVEARNMEEVRQVLDTGGADRLLLDNFTPAAMEKAIQQIDGRIATEASGNITLENVRKYAATGVDYISVGALTHSAPVMDISLVAG